MLFYVFEFKLSLGILYNVVIEQYFVIKPVVNDPPLWAQFEKLIDLHKFYFEHLIKAAAFSFGIVGAILTYVINTRFRHTKTLQLSLVLPFLISLGTSIIYLIGFFKTRDLNNQVKQLQQQLKIEWRPHSDILIDMCVTFSTLFLIISVGIIYFIIKPRELPQPQANK